MIDPRELFKNVNYEILTGYKYRGLHKVEGMSRVEFKQYCFRTIEEVCKEVTTPQEKEEARMTAIRAIAERSLFFFVIFCLKLDWVDSDYGYRLCNDVQNHKWNSLWVIAREHYKSLIITKASTLWELLKDPNRTYLIVSYNVSKAQGFLSSIKKWCEDNEFIQLLWSDVIWENPQRGYYYENDDKRVSWTWTQSALEFKRTRTSEEKSIEVSGIEGGLRTGGHFSHIIFDDAETPATVVTAESIEKCFNSIVMSTNVGQTANLNMCFIGTFYAKDDLYVRLIKKNYFKDSIIIQPCYDWETGAPLLFTDKQIFEKMEKMGLEAFITQMLCDPSLTHNSAFKSEWWRTWKADNLQGLNIYIVVDPAGNKQNKDNDNSVMLVVGIDALENLMIIDIIRDKLTAESKFTSLLELYGKYMPKTVYYEQLSMQADISLLENQMGRVNIRFPIIPFDMRKCGSKTQKIMKLQAPLMTGKIYFPEYAYHTNYRGEYENMINSLKVEEYYGFPAISHDDGLDALASAYQLLLDHNLVAPKNLLNSKGFFSKEAEDIPFEEVEDSLEGLI